jgi:predicted nucleic acid-binding protein
VRVLVDTSVWSRILRSKDPSEPVAGRLRELSAKVDIVLTGLILQELLQGFRAEAMFRRAARHFDSFPLLQLDRAHYVAAARIRRTCTAAGVATTTADCQIAAAAIEHRCALFTLDRDFERMARVTALRLVA